MQSHYITPPPGGQLQQTIQSNPAVHFQVHPQTSPSSSLNPTYGFDSQQLLKHGRPGTSFNTNNPYLPPPVPSNCLTKIKNLEYVDFGSLLTSILPNAANMASITEGEDIEEFCLSQVQQPGAAATFRKKTARNAINNFATWVMAWNVFYETTLHFYPNKHHELFSYFKHICEYAVNHKFKFLAAYDKAHRIHIAAQKNLPPAVQASSWTKHCPSLYNLYLKENMSAQCSNFLGWGHHAKQCPNSQNNASFNSQQMNMMTPPPNPPQQPANQFRNGGQQSFNSANPINGSPNTNSSGKKSCFRYNKNIQCQFPCDYPHICQVCLQLGQRQNHPAWQCPQACKNCLPRGQYHPATQCPYKTSSGFRPTN